MAGSRPVAANIFFFIFIFIQSSLPCAQLACRLQYGPVRLALQLPLLSCVQVPVCTVNVQFLVCNVQRACRDLLLGSFVPSVLCNPCPVCAVCYVTGWPLIPRPDAVYTIITHMRSARVLHGIMAYVAKRSKAVVVIFFSHSIYSMFKSQKPILCHFPSYFLSIFKEERERGARVP